MKPGDNDSLVRFSKPPQRTIAPAGGAARRSQEQREAGRTPDPIRVRRDGVETVARPSSRMAATEPVVPPRAAPSGNYGAPQEPYSWGEYLRRSYPVIGIILLLGAFWVWSARQLSTGPSPSPTAVLVAPTAAAPGAVPVITSTAPVVPAGAAASTLPVAPPGVIAPGARVIVQTPGGAGANIRANPTTSGVLVTAQDDGTPLTITGPSQDADGYTWWPVQGDGFAGWIAGSLIALP